MLTARVLFAMFFLGSSTIASSAPFSVRELTLGMPIQEACGDAEIQHSRTIFENMPDEGLKTLKRLGYKEIDDSDCARKLGVPDGINATEDENQEAIFGLDGKLVGTYYTLRNVSEDDSHALLLAYGTKYGKPKVSKHSGWLKYVWGNENKGDCLILTIAFNSDGIAMRASMERNPEWINSKQAIENNSKAWKLTEKVLQNIILQNGL